MDLRKSRTLDYDFFSLPFFGPHDLSDAETVIMHEDWSGVTFFSPVLTSVAK